jgi:hypothetical protein
MNEAALVTRMRRLDELAVGVARKIQLERKTDIFFCQEHRPVLMSTPVHDP